MRKGKLQLKMIAAASLILAFTFAMAACSSQDEEILGEDEGSTLSNLKVVDIKLSDEEYGIGVDKTQPELLQQVNAFVEKSLSDGILDGICAHYYDRDQSPVAVESAKADSSKDQLLVATTGDYEPFDYEEEGKYYGIDKEYAKALADYLGKDLVLVDVNFDMLLRTVEQKKCDVCIAGITIKEERKQYVDFSVPYYHEGLVIAAQKGDTRFDNAKSKEDIEEILSGLDGSVKIAVEEMTTAYSYCMDGNDQGFKGVKAKLIKCTSHKDALTKLSEGKADYVIGDSAVIKYIIAHN